MLGSVQGGVFPATIGGKNRTILIYIDPKKLQARKLSARDVVKALEDGNLLVTPGTAYFGDNQVLLDTNAMVKDVKELNDLPIRIEPGNNVYLRDIGVAEDSYAIQTSRVRINGRQQVYVPVYRKLGSSTLAVADRTNDQLPILEKRLPEGTKLDFVMDQSVYVREAIHSLIHEGVIGAILVAVMILIFLGNWRMTVIATMSIPLSVLAAIVGLYSLNFVGMSSTINAMTLSGLALAIGPLVDDAIVGLENTHRHMSMGKTRMKAAFDGAVEVMVPVLVATCTTIIVLAPLAFLPGMGGFLFRPLAFAVAFAMIASFILSRTFVPMMCSRFLKEHHHPTPEEQNGDNGNGHASSGVYGYIDRFLHRVTASYVWLLDWALQRRAFVLFCVAMLFLLALCQLRWIGREFFPQADAGQITMYVRAPSNMRLDAAEKEIIKVEKFINKHITDPVEKGGMGEPRPDMIVSEIGLDSDWSAAYTPNSGQQDAVIRIQLSKDRKKSAQEYAIDLRHAIRDNPALSEMRVSFDTGGMVSTALNYGVSSPIDIQIEGGTPAQGMKLAQAIRELTLTVRGAADQRVAQRDDAPYLILEVDRQKAASVGLSARDVMVQVVTAMNSSVSINRNFWIDLKSGNQYFVAVQYPQDPNAHLEVLHNIPAMGTNQSNPVMLSTLVRSYTQTNDAVEITHTGLARTFNVLVNTEGRDTAGVAGDIDKKVKTATLPLVFKLTDSSFNVLRAEQVPEDTLAKLEPLNGREFETREPFLKELRKVLDPVEMETHQDRLLKLAQVMRVELRGEYARMNQATRHLSFGLALAAVLVYLLLVALFRSWVGPFIIMFTVPLGLIGVLTMLNVTHTTLNVQSQMGVIFLVGIAVNNGVLLVDFANKKRREGTPTREAIRKAAATRFRPIIMTFLATFLDLTPMAIGLSRGGEATIPLARAVVGGLLTSTLLTLFVVPIMYTLLIRDTGEPERDIDAELEGPRPEFQALLPAPVKEIASIKGSFQHG
jgi:multidrug efflux pump subunit AcrB